MSDPPDPREAQIAALEAALRLPLPDAARHRITPLIIAPQRVGAYRIRPQ